MAEVKRYVNRASSAGGDGTTNGTAGATRAYYTLNEWEAAEQTDLVTDTDTHLVECTGTLGTQDTTNVYIDGWTTGASNDITINGLDPFNGYKMEMDVNSGGIISGTEDYINVLFVNVEQTDNTTGNRGIAFNSIGGTTNTKIVIAGCQIANSDTTDATPGGGVLGIQFKSNSNQYAINNFIHGLWNSGISASFLNAAATAYWYCNSVSGAYNLGFNMAGNASATAFLYNNISQGGGTDFSVNGAYTTGGNISEDTSSPESALRSITLTLTSATDLHLDSTDTEAIGAGVNLYSDSNYAVTTDIDGDARADAVFDIGADHFVGAPPAGAIMNQLQGSNMGADLFNGTLL